MVACAGEAFRLCGLGLLLFGLLLLVQLLLA
jgi:hypothetical protein